jgi:hypothetical protein
MQIGAAASTDMSIDPRPPRVMFNDSVTYIMDLEEDPRWSIRPECVLVPATSCSHLVFRGLVLVLVLATLALEQASACSRSLAPPITLQVPIHLLSSCFSTGCCLMAVTRTGACAWSSVASWAAFALCGCWVQARFHHRCQSTSAALHMTFSPRQWGCSAHTTELY